MIQITSTIAIDESEIEENFIRSPGPGGQNVNKVASAVQLRFDLARNSSLPPDVKARLVGLAGKQAHPRGRAALYRPRPSIAGAQPARGAGETRRAAPTGGD